MATTTMTGPTATTVPILRTTIGKKVAMALSGVVLLGFVVAHMIGNLKAFLGRAELDDYAHFLRRMGEPVLPHSVALWLLRTVVAVAFVVHVFYAIQLSVRSRRARVAPYAHPERVDANYASVTMRWGGLAIALFVAFHLAHFTWGAVHPSYTYVRSDVYHNVVESFRQWPLTLLYIAAMVALGMHLYHGTWSIFQTLGLNNRRWDAPVRRGAAVLAVAVFAGYTAVPVAVLTHAIH
ncbi:MAG: succinate dehydrogenase cytochrome b subunit [Acidimicrobiales bacterium]